MKINSFETCIGEAKGLVGGPPWRRERERDQLDHSRGNTICYFFPPCPGSQSAVQPTHSLNVTTIMSKMHWMTLTGYWQR